MSSYQGRRDKLRKLIKKSGAGGFLVTNFTNVTYLTGFTGDDSFLLILPDREVFLSDPRYTTQLKEECPGVDLAIRPPGTAMLKSIRKVLRPLGSVAVGFESNAVTVDLHRLIAEEITRVEWLACEGLVEQLRMVKDRDEIDSIRAAVAMAERSFEVVRCGLRADETERAVALSLIHI